jgi:hypothetical protein
MGSSPTKSGDDQYYDQEDYYYKEIDNLETKSAHDMEKIENLLY